jgi:hypothetical protein
VLRLSPRYRALLLRGMPKDPAMSRTNNWCCCAAVSVAIALPVACARHQDVPQTGWQPRAAAAYLDQRQDWWASWKTAARDHGTFCVSCHTVLTYALSRPALRGATGESRLVAQESRLLADVSKRTDLWNETGPYYASNEGAPKRTAQSRGTESVLNALVLAAHDAQVGKLSRVTRTAFEHMWSSQLTSGPDAGAWAWLDFGLEPWEASDSQYFGAAMGLLAVNIAPEAYRADPAIQENVSRLRGYLMREYSGQSLLNRTVLLWAARGDSSVVDSTRLQTIVTDLRAAQRSDGGWSLATLVRGTLFSNPRRYVSSWITSRQLGDEVSDGYATGQAVVVLLGVGTPRHDPVINRAVSWLTKNQDTKGGFWHALSLNESRDPYSGVGRFMTDASTAFAALALVEAADSTDVRASDGARSAYPGR